MLTVKAYRHIHNNRSPDIQIFEAENVKVVAVGNNFSIDLGGGMAEGGTCTEPTIVIDSMAVGIAAGDYAYIMNESGCTIETVKGKEKIERLGAGDE